MKGFAQEHLEAVAERNRKRFEKSENEFKAFMFVKGWTTYEIDQMIKYLKRGN